jgi:hypothetical protein
MADGAAAANDAANKKGSNQFPDNLAIFSTLTINKSNEHLKPREVKFHNKKINYRKITE